MNPPLIVDCLGLKCPMPVLRLNRALSQLRSGDRLTLSCTDPLARLDVPNALRQSGDLLLSAHEDGDVLSFTVQKS